MKTFITLILTIFPLLIFCQIDTVDLVAYYKFDNSLADASGNGYNGSSSSSSFGIDRKGNSKKALKFSSSSSPIILGKSPFNFTGSDKFTISVFVYADDLGSTATILSRCEESKISGYAFGLDENGYLRFISNMTSSLISDNKFIIGEWVHVAVTYENGQVNMYINGDLDKSGTINSINSNNYNTQVGRILNSKANNTEWHGNIDELMIYKKVLSKSEILNLGKILNGIHSFTQSKNVLVNILGKDIFIRNDLGERFQANIINLNGQMVSNYDIKSGENVINQSLQTGIYILRIVDNFGNNIISKKIFIY